MKELYSMLPVGQSKAIPISEVAALWDMPMRSARRMVERMWRSHYPVCNLFNGYFRPETREELKAYWKIIHSYKCNLESKERFVRVALDRFNNRRMPI
jgi:hypothetical protein